MLQRRFRAVPGVIDVTGWGGKTKTYELQVDFNKLIAYGLTLPQMLQALNNSNINVGGNTVNIGPQVAVVRGVGPDPLARRSPQHDADAERRHSGAGQRRGDGHRSATSRGSASPARTTTTTSSQGIVLMRRGEQSMPTIQRVEAEVERINSSATSCRRASGSSASTTART